MAQKHAEADVRRIITEAVRKRREYFANYRAKNRKHIRKYKSEFAARKRARSSPFSIRGYFDPKTRTVEINEIVFSVRRHLV